MKYLCLGYYDEKKFEALSKTELAAIVSQCPSYDAALRKSGHLVVTASLESPRVGKALRPRKGKISITDGPFTGTTEQVGAFFSSSRRGTWTKPPGWLRSIRRRIWASRLDGALR